MRCGMLALPPPSQSKPLHPHGISAMLFISLFTAKKSRNNNYCPAIVLYAFFAFLSSIRTNCALLRLAAGFNFNRPLNNN